MIGPVERPERGYYVTCPETGLRRGTGRGNHLDKSPMRPLGDANLPCPLGRNIRMAAPNYASAPGGCSTGASYSTGIGCTSVFGTLAGGGAIRAGLVSRRRTQPPPPGTGKSTGSSRLDDYTRASRSAQPIVGKRPQHEKAQSRVARSTHAGSYNGAPGRTRTPDIRIRNPMLYPAELRARAVQ